MVNRLPIAAAVSEVLALLELRADGAGYGTITTKWASRSAVRRILNATAAAAA